MTSQQNLPILYGGPTSPFARMAKIYGDLLGAEFTYEQIDIYNAEFIDQHNPLRQIPTMVIADVAIFDSRTIFEYFEAVTDRNVDKADFLQATRISLALGMSDACLQYRMEMMLAEGDRNEVKIQKLKARMDRSVAKLEAWADLIFTGQTRLEQVVVACALEYLDFRYNRDWRTNCVKLDTWMQTFSKRSDMRQTQPIG